MGAERLDRRGRSRATSVLAVVIALGGGYACGRATRSDSSTSIAATGRGTAISTTAPSPTGPTTSTTIPVTTTTMPPTPSDTTTMSLRDRITGDLSPKSVVASGTGLVFAQNMMYTHTISVFSAADLSLAKTISDSVDLANFGIDGHPGTSQGAPVEAAFTSDGAYAYVSNYSMYGENFGPEGSDECEPEDGYDDSFVYRISTATLEIDQVIGVGSVPKYVAVTPDDRFVLVTNWCTFDLSVIDVASATEVQRIPIGRHPRGIAVATDSRTAYVAVMGEDVIVSVDLDDFTTEPLVWSGDGPRHIVLSLDGATLYVTHNSSGTVASVDVASGEVTNSVSTGSRPRTMAISADGRALYVVNYDSSTVTKLAASDLRELDIEETDYHPIGIAYEPTTQSVWVACYGGSIMVFDDRTT
jgi:YVTN family beta-propeller protein